MINRKSEALIDPWRVVTLFVLLLLTLRGSYGLAAEAGVNSGMLTIQFASCESRPASSQGVFAEAENLSTGMTAHAKGTGGAVSVSAPAGVYSIRLSGGTCRASFLAGIFARSRRHVLAFSIPSQAAQEQRSDYFVVPVDAVRVSVRDMPGTLIYMKANGREFDGLADADATYFMLPSPNIVSLVIVGINFRCVRSLVLRDRFMIHDVVVSPADCAGNRVTIEPR